MITNKTLIEFLMTKHNSSGFDADVILANRTHCDVTLDEYTCSLIGLYNEHYNRVLELSLVVVMVMFMVTMMLFVGLTIDYSKMYLLLQNPKLLLIGFTCQFLCMPLFTYVVIILFKLRSLEALCLLLIGCSPGGTISNVFAYMFRGDMNVSVLFTWFSSIIGLALMPINLKLWFNLINFQSDIVVPYVQVFCTIVFFIIPVIAGSLVGRRFPQKVDAMKKVGKYTIILLSLANCGLGLALFAKLFIKFFPYKLLAACAVLPLAGYLVGFVAPRIFKQELKSCRTLMVETGCQNANICAAVLKLSFNPLDTGIYFLIPYVYMCLQIQELFAIYAIWKNFLFNEDKEQKYVEANQSTEEEIMT